MIREINLFEYLKDFEALRTALSDFYIKTKNCQVFGAYENGVGVGFLLCEERRMFEILFLCAENDDEKIKDGLLGAFLDTLPSGTAVRWRIVNDTKNANTQLAVNRGFAAESVLHIFHFKHADSDAVHSVIDRYTHLYTFMEKRGYVTKPFETLTEDELHQIRDNPDGEFAAYLESGEHIKGNTGKLDERCSFAAVRDGKVFAYVIVVAHGEKSCIVENVSVAHSARRGGTFILPFLSMLSALKQSNYDTVSFAIYETNADIMPMMRKNLSALLTSETVQRNYVLIKKEKEKQHEFFK